MYTKIKNWATNKNLSANNLDSQVVLKTWIKYVIVILTWGTVLN